MLLSARNVYATRDPVPSTLNPPRQRGADAYSSPAGRRPASCFRTADRAIIMVAAFTPPIARALRKENVMRRLLVFAESRSGAFWRLRRSLWRPGSGRPRPRIRLPGGQGRAHGQGQKVSRAVARLLHRVVDDKQRQAIYDIQEEYAPKVAVLQAQLKALLQERNEKVEAVLTAEQLEKIAGRQGSGRGEASASRRAESPGEETGRQEADRVPSRDRKAIAETTAGRAWPAG